MSINIEKILQVVSESGLEVQTQAAFYKVALADRAVYISRTKGVSRVDVSGFSFKHPALTRLTAKAAQEMKLGRVRGQINFGKSEDRVLECLRTALETMKHLAAVDQQNAAQETQAAPAPAKVKTARASKTKAVQPVVG